MVRSESGSKRTPETEQHGGVERVGDVVFLAYFSSRNALTPEFLGAVKDEATQLRQRVQERLKRREKLPLTYIAAFKALGWELD